MSIRAFPSGGTVCDISKSHKRLTEECLLQRFVTHCWFPERRFAAITLCYSDISGGNNSNIAGNGGTEISEHRLYGLSGTRKLFAD